MNEWMNEKMEKLMINYGKLNLIKAWLKNFRNCCCQMVFLEKQIDKVNIDCHE